MVRTGVSDGWTPGAAWVGLLGVVLAAAATANLVLELSELEVVWPPAVVWLLGTALGAAHVYAGVLLRRSDLDAGDTRRVAAYGTAGAALLAGIIAFTVAIRLAEGRSVGEPQLTLLVAAGAGGLAGTVVGHRTALVRRAAARAERSRDSLAFLNRTLRHEVLNGVQLVAGYAEDLDDHVEGDGGTAVETVRETADELADLIEDVRAIADVHAGEVDPEPVDLSALVAAEVERLREAHPNAVVENDVPEGVHARATDAVVHAVRNLLENAVEHNEGTPRVEVGVEGADDAVRLRVADDGPGIPADRRGDLFEPRTGETHGFGLHLVRTLAEGYGGRVTLADGSDGATFLLELPRAEAPPRDDDEAAPPAEPVG